MIAAVKDRLFTWAILAIVILNIIFGGI